jgi:hypothetical protein
VSSFVRCSVGVQVLGLIYSEKKLQAKTIKKNLKPSYGSTRFTAVDRLLPHPHPFAAQTVQVSGAPGTRPGVDCLQPSRGYRRRDESSDP